MTVMSPKQIINSVSEDGSLS